jgi:RHS repeat-associated protein
LSTVRHINFRNAEYDVSNVLRRKYIYGPCTDEPISMIEAAGNYVGTYYYHCDGLGSVVGLTNSSGNTVEVYEYDVYGRLGATDASHPNRFMFTGREYDKETGLYYYRARYYNPQIGRFLQTDPVGYEAGINWYRYCVNNPLNCVDPQGLRVWREKNGGEWHRVPKPGNHFPEIGPPNWNPFFYQTMTMDCVAVAILNAALNAGTEPLNETGTAKLPFSAMETDLAAEAWVVGQVSALCPKGDPWNFGFSIKAAPKVLGIDKWKLIERPPTASRIQQSIDGGKTVIMGINLNQTGKGNAVWHAITIIKTPEGATTDPERKYCVLQGDPSDRYAEGRYYTEEEFRTWLNCWGGFWGEWVEGPGAN